MTPRDSQLDHILELQRVEYLFREESPPEKSGISQKAWDIARTSVALETDVSHLKIREDSSLRSHVPFQPEKNNDKKLIGQTLS